MARVDEGFFFAVSADAVDVLFRVLFGLSSTAVVVFVFAALDDVVFAARFAVVALAGVFRFGFSSGVVSGSAFAFAFAFVLAVDAAFFVLAVLGVSVSEALLPAAFFVLVEALAGVLRDVVFFSVVDFVVFVVRADVFVAPDSVALALDRRVRVVFLTGSVVFSSCCAEGDSVSFAFNFKATAFDRRLFVALDVSFVCRPVVLGVFSESGCSLFPADSTEALTLAFSFSAMDVFADFRVEFFAVRVVVFGAAFCAFDTSSFESVFASAEDFAVSLSFAAAIERTSALFFRAGRFD